MRKVWKPGYGVSDHYQFYPDFDGKRAYSWKLISKYIIEKTKHRIDELNLVAEARWIRRKYYRYHYSVLVSDKSLDFICSTLYDSFLVEFFETGKVGVKLLWKPFSELKTDELDTAMDKGFEKLCENGDFECWAPEKRNET